MSWAIDVTAAPETIGVAIPTQYRMEWWRSILRKWKSAFNPRKSSIWGAQNQKTVAFDMCTRIWFPRGLTNVFFKLLNFHNPSFIVKNTRQKEVQHLNDFFSSPQNWQNSRLKKPFKKFLLLLYNIKIKLNFPQPVFENVHSAKCTVRPERHHFR